MTSSLQPQKITMVIQVVPSPRLNVVRECREAIHGITEARRSIDDGLANESADDAAVNIKVKGSSLAFDVTPEDLFLLDRESMESLLSDVPKTVTVVFFHPRPDGARNNDYDADQENYTKIKLTFIPVLKQSQSVHNGIGRKKNNRGNDSERNAIPERLLQKFKKWLHDAIKAHGY